AEPNPLIGVRDSICRRTPSGRKFGPSEGLKAEEAVALYTREAAYFSFEEKERGTLKEGKVADLVVLDRNPLEVPAEAISNCRVKMTVVGGRIVYEGS
ncbi:MAG: amidohydrolase family protein, partial [Deltaproteobacteria bacterium]|nr:amidohydrolase family protein [Deltaproteobacteria bacterium]